MTVFFPSLSSLFFCSVFQGTPSHSSCTTWQSLQNISTSVRRQAMEWEAFLLAAEQLAHPNMYTLQVLTFSSVLTILKLLAEYRLALWRSTEKHDESSALATQCETPCATRLSYHGICTILRAIRTIYVIRKGPIWVFGPKFLTFLHYSIEEVERQLLWKVYEKIRRKSLSNVPPKLLACIRFLYKVVHKIGHLRKFNRSREIEFNFLTAWTISMKFDTLVQHAPGYKREPQIF